jgi:NAD(P)-dependent dehydrogenase (short-subunit alcohol dehydrogenase family)
LPPIRAIFINATVWQAGGQQFSAQGYEMNFAANYLAHFLLVLLLLGSMDKRCGRVVITSSSAHDPYGAYSGAFITEDEHRTVFTDLETLAHPRPDVSGDEASAGVRRYGMSKMLLIMFMYVPPCPNRTFSPVDAMTRDDGV